jgi:hypothetical protein
MKPLQNLMFVLILITFQPGLSNNSMAQVFKGEITSLSFQNTPLIDTMDTYNLKIKPGWNWISFPRLERDGGDPPAQQVLEKIRPFPSSIYMENLPLIEGYYQTQNIAYSGIGWEGDLLDLHSTYGYKYSTSNQYVSYQPMLGTILDPEITIQLWSDKENWVGYFPTWPQSPFDALASVLDKLTLIKHHDWVCVKESSQMLGPGEPDPTCWICSKTSPLKYADMLILECSENVTLQWGEEFSAEMHDLQEPEHFTYSETSDYAPIFIELDSNDQPLEIGAYVGDSCIGATVVETGDSVIMIRGYLPEQTSGTITFEKYYGSEKALPARISDYYVKNNATGIREKRAIDSREKSKYYQVSFKKESNAPILANPIKINFYPNPCPGAGTIEYFLPDDSDVTFEVLDVYGRKVNSLVFSNQQSGSYSTIWPRLSPGGSLQGVFLLRMFACGNSLTTKLILTK